MSNDQIPKWTLATAVTKGRQSITLMTKYDADLGARLPADSKLQHSANVSELASRSVGQKEILNQQKVDTKGQNDDMKAAHEAIINIRKVVQNGTPTDKIAQAFGIGTKLLDTVNSVTAAGNLIISAFGANTEWSKTVGIIDEDIDDLKSFLNNLGSSDSTQEDTKFTRKAKTLDKNTLQRSVEEMVSKISSIGVMVFAKKDPAIVPLFADLIPNSPSKSDTATTTQTTTQTKA